MSQAVGFSYWLDYEYDRLQIMTEWQQYHVAGVSFRARVFGICESYGVRIMYLSGGKNKFTILAS